MKCGIEAGDLRQSRMRGRQRPDRSQVLRQMQRHERHQRVELRQYRRVDPYRRLMPCASEHNPVSGRLERTRPRVLFDPLHQPPQQRLVGPARTRTPSVFGDLRTALVARAKKGRRPHPFDRAVGHAPQLRSGAGSEQRELDAG